MICSLYQDQDHLISEGINHSHFQDPDTARNDQIILDLDLSLGYGSGEQKDLDLIGGKKILQRGICNFESDFI